MSSVPTKGKKGFHIDMTPMSDLAWLLLTFFILTAEFKQQETVPIVPPASSSPTPMNEKKDMRLMLSKDGKYLFAMDDEEKRIPLLESMGQIYSIAFTDQEKSEFKKLDEVAISIKSMKEFLALSKDQKKNFDYQGITKDSINKELLDWVSSSRNLNDSLQLAIKVDGDVEYPKVKELLNGLQTYNINKFRLVTNSTGGTK